MNEGTWKSEMSSRISAVLNSYEELVATMEKMKDVELESEEAGEELAVWLLYKIGLMNKKLEDVV